MNQGKQRHGCLTAYLVVAIILSAIASLGNLLGGAMIQRAFPNAPVWAMPVLAFIGVFHIVCLVALFQWKKWGFYGVVLCSLASVAVNLIVGLGIGQALFGLIGIAVLYGVLQIGGGTKGWTQLE